MNVLCFYFFTFSLALLPHSLFSSFLRRSRHPHQHTPRHSLVHSLEPQDARVHRCTLCVLSPLDGVLNSGGLATPADETFGAVP